MVKNLLLGSFLVFVFLFCSSTKLNVFLHYQIQADDTAFCKQYTSPDACNIYTQGRCQYKVGTFSCIPVTPTATPIPTNNSTSTFCSNNNTTISNSGGVIENCEYEGKVCSNSSGTAKCVDTTVPPAVNLCPVSNSSFGCYDIGSQPAGWAQTTVNNYKCLPSGEVCYYNPNSGGQPPVDTQPPNSTVPGAGAGGGQSGSNGGGDVNEPVYIAPTNGFCADQNRENVHPMTPTDCDNINNATYVSENDYCRNQWGGGQDYFYQCNGTSTSTSPTPSAGPEQQACQYHNGVKSYGGGFCGTAPDKDHVYGFDAAKAATKAFCSMNYYDMYTCNDGTPEYFPTPNGSTLCSQDPWCPASTSPGGGGNGSSGGTTTPSNCTSVTFSPSVNGNADVNETAAKQCTSLPGCFVSVENLGQTERCLPTSLQGSACGDAFCKTNEKCITNVSQGQGTGGVYCAPPQELGQNCGDKYASQLDNPDCDASQNLLCDEPSNNGTTSGSYTCQYKDASGAPTPTPGVSIDKGGLGTACKSGGGCGYYQGNPLGCYPAIGGSLNNSDSWVCTTRAGTWCSTNNTLVSDPSQCPATGSGGTSTTTPIATTTPAPGSLAYQADCPNVNTSGPQAGRSNVCTFSTTCPAGYEPHSSVDMPGGTPGDKVCKEFEDGQAAICCTKIADSSSPVITSPPTPTPTRIPTATPVPGITPITVCGNSANQMQNGQQCTQGSKIWQYVPEPTLTTAQHVNGCNDQFPYHFVCK